jgi:hypothetical protein
VLLVVATIAAGLVVVSCAQRSAPGAASVHPLVVSDPAAPSSVPAAVTCRPTPDDQVSGAGRADASTGTLYYDRNQNGRQDPGEPGLGGIPVYLGHGADALTPSTEKYPATCTDANGRYRLTPPDRYNGYRIEVRTGWFRSQCPGLICGPGGVGNNLQAGPEWLFSAVITGAQARVYNAGLIPDAGQYVVNLHSTSYSAYPPDLSNAHVVDLAARFTDDESGGCRTTVNGVSCHIGQAIDQTLYIANSGTTAVSEIQGVMQLPYGEVHHELVLLRTGTSPGITALTHVTVTPAIEPRGKGQAASAANFTTISFSLEGSLPPGGMASVLSVATLVAGHPGTQIVGRAGITYESDQVADTDSVFCATPTRAKACPKASDTHSLLDRRGDDNDSDRFNVLGP